MKLSINLIALCAMLLGTAVVVYIFSASRNDPGLRIAALTLGGTASGTLLAIASTLLTGRDLTNRQSDLPPGTTQLTQVPPNNATVNVAGNTINTPPTQETP